MINESFTTSPFHNSNNSNSIEIVALSQAEWDYLETHLANGEVMCEDLMQKARQHSMFEQAISISNVTGI